jgi:toxin ParE1/3/4
MAAKPPRLSLTVTPAAQRDLKGIWAYNAEIYNPKHADDYVAFLDHETVKLEREYHRGKPVPGRIGLQYRNLRKGRGHLHIVVYEVVGQTVEVLRYFHGRQDWQSRLAKGEE